MDLFCPGCILVINAAILMPHCSGLRGVNDNIVYRYVDCGFAARAGVIGERWNVVS